MVASSWLKLLSCWRKWSCKTGPRLGNSVLPNSLADIGITKMQSSRWQQWEKDQAKKRQGTRTDIKETFPESSVGQSRDKAGKRVGVSGKSTDLRTKPPELTTGPLDRKALHRQNDRVAGSWTRSLAFRRQLSRVSAFSRQWGV